MADYLVVTSAENWERTAALGWIVVGLKSTKRHVATSLNAGDRLLCYATGVKRFLAVVSVEGPCYEDHSPVWTAKKAGEDYPFRYPIRPIVAVGLEHALDAMAFADVLDFPKKWGEHRSLAFQGNIKAVPAQDVDRVVEALQQAQPEARTPAILAER